MAKNADQKLKLLYLLKILLRETDPEHTLTMNDILERLENLGLHAERKSIYDDFAALERFGYPVERQRGENNTVGYYIESRKFELPELKLLVDAVQSSNFITRQKSHALIEKLSGLVSRWEAQTLQRQVHISDRVKTMNESIYYNVDQIHTAILENKRITFQYFDWTPEKGKRLRKGGVLYCVSPWALTWSEGNYYLVAFDGEYGDIKHFRVDKMLRISAVDQQREGQGKFRQFDMARYSQKVFGMFGGREETVTLECDNDLAGVIIDRFGRDVTLFPGKNTFFVSVSVMISNNFFSWVLQFGGRMRITAPQSVIEEMRSLLSEVTEIYEGNK